MNAICKRYFSLSNPFYKTNKEWLALKRHHRKRSDLEWKRRHESNPFIRNVGISSQMKALELNPERDLKFDVLKSTSVDMAVEEIGDRFSSARNSSIDPHYKQKLDSNKIKHIMAVKRIRKSEKDPSLLTWIEKETIRYLYDSDPTTWTIDVLAESFPGADVKVIKRVLKNRVILPLEKIRSYDERVVSENWNRLRDGRLEIRDDLKRHILESRSLKTGNNRMIPAESTIISNYMSERYWTPLKRKSGEFSSLISDYNNDRVRAQRGSIPTNKNLFKRDQLLYGTLDINVPSPYRDTALLDTSVDIRRERPMTIRDFKKRIKKGKDGRDSIQTQFYEWMKDELEKDSWIRPSKIDPDVVLE